jgi:hypothetical protein
MSGSQPGPSRRQLTRPDDGGGGGVGAVPRRASAAGCPMTNPRELPKASLRLAWIVLTVDTAAGPHRIPLVSRWMRRAWKAALERLARAGELSV